MIRAFLDCLGPQWRRHTNTAPAVDFARFHPGEIQIPQGFHPTWAGTLIRDEFDGASYGGQIAPQPAIDEQWFEWASLLAALSDARGTFRMAELGAGFGRWAVAGAVFARRLDLRAELVCVEAEPSHFAMMRQHFIDNGLDPDEHRLIQAAMAREDGPVWFTVGQPVDWWGQATLPSQDYGFGGFSNVEVQQVRGISLATALDGCGLIDLIDMDIQGAEADVIESSLGLLTREVRRLFIGTHGAEIEARVRKSLCGRFQPVWDFPCGQRAETPIGKVSFQDGVQAWINPSLTTR